jgi:hypothetical protein
MDEYTLTRLDRSNKTQSSLIIYAISLYKVPHYLTIYSYALSDVVHESRLPVVNIQAAYNLGCIKHGYGPLDAGFYNPPDPWRFMVSTTFPFLDKHLNRTESGILCKGCNWASLRVDNEDYNVDILEAMRASFRKGRTAFSEKGLLQHFEVCEDAKKLWDRRVRERQERDEREARECKERKARERMAKACRDLHHAWLFLSSAIQRGKEQRLPDAQG